MEFLRQALNQIKKFLAGLKTTERLAIFLILVIICMAVYWMADYSAQREMVPLLKKSFTEQQRGRIESELTTMGETYRVSGDQIHVLKTRERSIVDRLSFNEALPEDIVDGWASLLDGGNLWMPESARETKEKVILQKELARTISSWKGVRKAQVFINEGGKRRLNNRSSVASASVSITSDNGTPSKRKLASSTAALVSAAINRLKREDVQVIIDGRHIRLGADGEQLSGLYIEQFIFWENHYREKIINALPVRNALVQVDLKLQNSTTTTETREISPDGQGSWLATVETNGSETSSKNIQKGEEPGFVANNSDSNASASGTSSDQKAEEEVKKSKPFPGHKLTQKSTPPGGVPKEDRTASVYIPLSYFEGLAKRETESDQELDPDKIKEVVGRELPGLKAAVMRAMGLSGEQYEDNVVVDADWAGVLNAGDTALAGSGSGTGSAAESTATVAGVFTRYGKHIAVSALAMISLFMVLMMVRKASGPTEFADDSSALMMGKKPPDALSVEDSNIIDGEEPGGLLEGMELNDEVVRSQQILQQIREMVENSPEVAAKLVKKWVSNNS